MDKDIDALEYKVGDLIAVIQTDASGKPNLGMLAEETRRTPGSCRLPSWGLLARVPAREDRPELEFLDEHTPVFYYGE